ncbi:hypothetical protein AVEN_160764-1 [Araneus ventricosus]|uniref:Uncharacterized protein n=1 Tax=Araneus ventricosus TaxID=182803 RepID=A0A4Y2XB68_ARAVE|nr:hypothetical protein AVEN_64957-1 [Araneus ventricosus]GBO46165.1 hypothetical protein AVEN_160764-1 [Araneus ventricosus]
MSIRSRDPDFSRGFHRTSRPAGKEYKYSEKLNLWNAFGLQRISLQSCSHCELVSCLTLRVIVRTITVIISDLLSACVANLRKCCFSRYLFFAFFLIIRE